MLGGMSRIGDETYIDVQVIDTVDADEKQIEHMHAV
jgi:hypothetical protein